MIGGQFSRQRRARSPRQGAAGTDSASLVIAGKSLVAVHDWTFLLGPALVAGFGNGLRLGYLMYRSGLVPRRWHCWGSSAALWSSSPGSRRCWGPTSRSLPVTGIATIPEFAWELSLGIYLIVKGFKPSHSPPAPSPPCPPPGRRGRLANQLQPLRWDEPRASPGGGVSTPRRLTTKGTETSRCAFHGQQTGHGLLRPNPRLQLRQSGL